MYKNQLEQFIIVSLKYFFNVEPCFCQHAFIAALLLPCVLKLLVDGITASFHDGILTVKDDFTEMKAIIGELVHKLRSGEIREALVNNVRALRINLPGRNLRNW